MCKYINFVLIIKQYSGIKSPTWSLANHLRKAMLNYVDIKKIKMI